MPVAEAPAADAVVVIAIAPWSCSMIRSVDDVRYKDLACDSIGDWWLMVDGVIGG
jgi:hypothetical protein